MAKQIFNELQESLKQAVAVSKGKAEPARRIVYTDKEVAAIREGRAHEVKTVRAALEVKEVRERLQLSQSEFAKLIRVNVRTLQNWEQGHRCPTGPAVALLKLVNGAPEVALKVLHA
ncbi:MAG: helix-turn-helix domain-containing protein [Desulfovibrionaceae bacterium]|nr:helix-turn-helix domain-containing protein [Desulfovibrionaceae bacterium]